MTRKKSNVKALALAVTCAILAGGGIGLEPVYAADVVTYNTSTNKLIHATTTEIETLTIGDVTIGGSGTTYGITIGDTSKHVMISDHDISATGSVSANIIASGINARMEGGKVVAQNGLYIGYDGTDITKATYDNSRFAVKGDDGSFKAAGGKFTVDKYGNIKKASSITTYVNTLSTIGGVQFKGNNIDTSGAITAASLKLNGMANDVKTTIETNASDIATNAANIATKADQTALNTANGKITALEEKTTNFNADGTTLINMTEVGADKVSATTLEVGGKVITADKVDGYDAAVSKTANITYDAATKTTYINKDADQQVVIDEKGLKVGKNSSRMNDITGFATSKNLYVGTTDADNPTAADSKFFVDGNDGSLKAADGAFTVDGTGKVVSSSVTANLGGFNHVQINNGLTVGTAGGTNVAIGGGGIIATNGTDTVAVGNGAIVATGDITGKDITATGNLSVVGTSTFTGKTTFSGGIKTDTIEEVTADQGVTVDGVLLKDGGVNASAMSVTGATGSLNVKDIGGTSTMIYTKKADGTNTIWIDPATGNISTNGTLQVGGGVAGTKPSVTIDGATGSIKVGQNDTEKFAVDGTTGNVKTKGSLEVASNATVGGTLGVTGKTTLNDELQVDKTATFGTAVGSQTVIKGDQIATGRIETDATQASKIGGVTLQNGKVTATDMTVTGTIDFNNLKVNDTLTVGTNTKITEGTLQLGTAEDNKLTADKLANINQTIKSGKVIEANSANIGGVEIKGGNVTTTGTVQGNTISDGAGATLTGGKITAKEGKIGNVEISAAGAVTGVSEIKANTFKVDDNNFLNNNGITAKGGTIGGAVINETTLNIGSTTLDKAEGITTNKLKIAGMTLTGTSLDTGTADFQVNGVTFNQGKVTAQADKGFVAGTSSFKQDSLIVDANNKLEKTQGLTTEKATVNGTLDVTGKATFGAAGQQTTIEGDAVTTDTLKANKLILGASGTATVEVDKDGSLKAANGKFAVDKDGALKAAGGAFNVAKDGKTTFTKDADNLSFINGGNIWAKATDAADHTSSELTHDYKGLHVSGNKAGQTSAFDFDTATGISTFTGQDNSSVTINGSAIRSAKSDGTAGKLDGENLTLYKDGNNQTTMSAGKATFTGDAGEKGGKVTTINGGTISTDTLNVERINLGEDILDSNGNPHGSNLSMDKQGNFSAAGGNFKVTGGTTGSRGSITNIVGDDTTGKTAFETNQQGANMSFEKGSVKSEVSVADDSAKISAGASSIEVKDGSITNNGVTTFNGTTGTTTKIDGGTITTNHLITDKLTITGSGNADGTGSGSIAFGGNGSITSNIKDATTGKEATFKTDEKGTFTEAKDNDGNKTTNTVNAKGNTNVVTDSTNTSTATQTATSIGGVVTNGTVTMRQELTADGVKVSVDGDTANYTQITNKDVSITDQKNPGKRINLSDLGQLNDLDGELTARDEYTNNKTAVGAINAEAGIRREEVARLDNRIDDVNNRVDKVGAMAAAIASLKSIGYDPQAPSEFSIGLGQYKGETGVAMGFFHYPNKNFMINVSLSTAGGETMGGIGATWRFGHKSPQKLLEEQREAQAKKELAAAEKYQAAAKLAKEAQERAEYAAKLARQAQVSADNAKAAADATQAKHFG